MVLYNYTVSGNMNGNNPNLEQLRSELIGIGIIGISQQGDNLTFEFSGEVDTVVLESIMQNHVPKIIFIHILHEKTLFHLLYIKF